MGLDDVRDAAGFEIEPQLDIRERLNLSRRLDSGPGVEAHAGEKHALFYIVDDPFEAVAMVLEWLAEPETMRGAKLLREAVTRLHQETAGSDFADRVIREISI